MVVLHNIYLDSIISIATISSICKNKNDTSISSMILVIISNSFIANGNNNKRIHSCSADIRSAKVIITVYNFYY